MRHLFMPACVCLMTWSGTAGTGSTLPSEVFATKSKKIVVATAESDEVITDPVGIQIPVDADATEVVLENAAAEPTIEFPKGIPLPPVAKPVVQRSYQEVCDTLTDAAQKNNLPVPFFIHLLFQESGFNPAVVSPAGAQGIAQFMPETAADMGVKNPFDPLQAIPASARLLRNLVAQFGNLGLAAAAYNAGPKRIQNWLEKKVDKQVAEKKIEKKPALPEETQGYVKIITGRPVENWKQASAALPAHRLPRHAPCQEAAGLYAWSGPETIPLPQASPLTHRAAAPPVQVAKTGIKVVSQQFAARKHVAPKQKLEKLAQR